MSSELFQLDFDWMLRNRRADREIQSLLLRDLLLVTTLIWVDCKQDGGPLGSCCWGSGVVHGQGR